MTNRTLVPALLMAFSLTPSMVNAGILERAPMPEAVHPDHGASFLEQLTGQWVIRDADGEESRRFRFYEDGRFAFMDAGEWTAGSYVILRTDERQKGVLRLEFYVDGNLHLQEVLCEVYFTAEAEDRNHEHGHDGAMDHSHASDDGHGDGVGEDHHHEYLKVEVLPAAEHALPMEGDYLHRH